MDALRQTILEVFPGVVENMDYKLPTYSIKNTRVCAIASQKNYRALYVMNYDLLGHFNEELQRFNWGRSCIRF